MVSLKMVGSQIVDYNYKEFYGLSTDEKPKSSKAMHISNSSTFYEMDTKKLFMYDETNHIWLEQ